MNMDKSVSKIFIICYPRSSYQTKKDQILNELILKNSRLDPVVNFPKILNTKLSRIFLFFKVLHLKMAFKFVKYLFWSQPVSSQLPSWVVTLPTLCNVTHTYSFAPPYTHTFRCVLVKSDHKNSVAKRRTK